MFCQNIEKMFCQNRTFPRTLPCRDEGRAKRGFLEELPIVIIIISSSTFGSRIYCSQIRITNCCFIFFSTNIHFVSKFWLVWNTRVVPSHSGQPIEQPLENQKHAWPLRPVKALPLWNGHQVFTPGIGLGTFPVQGGIVLSRVEFVQKFFNKYLRDHP